MVVSLSGAHAYGFPSPDSDLDLKAVHVEMTERLLGLQPPDPHVARLEVLHGVEIDYTSNEIGPVLGALLHAQAPPDDKGKELEELQRKIANLTQELQRSQQKQKGVEDELGARREEGAGLVPVDPRDGVDPGVARHLDGKTLIKEIFVPGRIVTLVVK